MNTTPVTYKTGPNSSAIIWGVLIVLAGGLILAWGVGVGFNTKAVLAISLSVAGILLLVAAIIPAFRRPKEQEMQQDATPGDPEDASHSI